LTDGNERLTAYNTITKPTVATVGLLFKTLRRKVAYLLVANLLIANGKQIQKNFIDILQIKKCVDTFAPAGVAFS
jgi:hypothetical protein